MCSNCFQKFSKSVSFVFIIHYSLFIIRYLFIYYYHYCIILIYHLSLLFIYYYHYCIILIVAIFCVYTHKTLRHIWLYLNSNNEPHIGKSHTYMCHMIPYVCVCVCVHIYTYIFIHIYTHICMYIYIHMYTYIHTYDIRKSHRCIYQITKHT